MDDDMRKTLLYKLNKDTLINLIVKENITEVYVLYYNSESSGDDRIVSIHRTLQGAVDKIIAIDKEEGNYDEDGDYKLSETPNSSKGVNQNGWSVGTYNIYPISFEN